MTVRAAILAGLLGWTTAATATDPATEVTVLATRVPAAVLTVPASVDRVDGARLRDGAGVNLSEAMGPVPGVSIQNRGNYAQDLQISIRGFGARSSFGARGIRLLADGIPGTQPDGQGQYSHFDLSGADRIEVLRGPFSVLYGNAAGGVIAITTADAPPGPSLNATLEGGSDGVRRYALRGGDGARDANWTLDAAHFQTDGYRAHSAASRNTANGKWRWDLTPTTRVTVIGNLIETPFVDDPLGLTAGQWAADPAQAGTNALAYNTRKSVTQQQAGIVLDSRWSEHDTVTLSTYAGHRHSTQFQAILKSVEALAAHPGGVIDLDRRYQGGELRWTDAREWFGVPLRWTGGIAVDDLTEDRRGYLNYVGTTLGVEGALRRDERNRADALDEYLQVEWTSPADRWRWLMGVRHTDLAIDSVSRLLPLSPATRVDYAATHPVAGVSLRIAPSVATYLSYGSGFETPTLNDLAYRSTNGAITGLNTALRPARSDHVEWGLKHGTATLQATLAAFLIRTDNELAVQANSGGRSVMENIGPTRRRGLEGSVVRRWSERVSLTGAVTALDARTLVPYQACAATPCVPVTVAAGSRLPAVPRNALYTGLTVAATPEWSVTAETVGRSGLYADDRNTAYAAGYWTSNARVQWTHRGASGTVHATLRLDNLADRRYVGSVIVNESNARYYEPAAGRTVLAILRLDWR
jgi:iron complex outermembrane recepter protein